MHKTIRLRRLFAAAQLPVLFVKMYKKSFDIYGLLHILAI